MTGPLAPWVARQEEMAVAKAVRHLLTAGASDRGVTTPRHWRALDTELAAYLRHVDAVGQEAWSEELSRVRRRQAAATERGDHWAGGGAPALSLVAIMDLMPTWRAWGRMLKEGRT
ncbi:hypothetical protein SAMN05421508_11921 [Caenispirillum bisanense]|uniref:Uncharacterized protein n=1 Tax=Caenispirillum bisanense TaxID=414052 RepID=A0A286H1B7_9PROT|nr:hypothetical protein SAMN05421508_11921 [Caenispirillum bisanense]